MKFLRRLGSGSTKECVGCRNCPDILELEGGDFAVIGTDITSEAPNLPLGSGCSAEERIVRIPRELLIRARADIPECV